jgi:CheY-like chemotaxis protein
MVDMRVHLDKGLPCVFADTTQIHQIVTNLCTNAWHAIGERPSGCIQIALEKTVPTAGQIASHPELLPIPYVRLSIRDNGCGMDAATRARAFDPFFTTKPPGVGTGLGLSVVHGIMRSYDGAIVFETEPGRGCVFELYFPVCGTQDVKSPQRLNCISRGHGQKILLVDDEPMLVHLGKRMIEHLGYSVQAFTDPLQALDSFEKQGADLILVDLSMPGLTGLEFSRRAMAFASSVPVVLMTGYSASITAEQIKAQGLRDMLFKPYNLEILGRLLSQIFDKAGAAS